MPSEVEICNMALSHLGHGRAIASLDEASQEADACSLFYSPCLEQTLRDWAWPFANTFAALALVEEDPTDEWSFSYRYPTNCIRIIRILSGIRNDTRQSRAPYKIGRDDDGLLIYTDYEDAEIEYTHRADDAGRFPYDFALALSYRIASNIAPRLTKGDPFKLAQRAIQMYQYELGRAQANAGNEEQAEEPPDSEFIRARE